MSEENISVKTLITEDMTREELYYYAKHLEEREAELLNINNKLQKKAELGEHYKHLYSEVKKQKDDVVECCKNSIKSINEKLENNKEQFELVKKYLREHGQEELVNCIREEYTNEK